MSDSYKKIKKEITDKIKQVMTDLLVCVDGDARVFEIAPNGELATSGALLSGYMYTLSTVIGEANRNEAESENTYKTTRDDAYMAYRAEGKTSKDAESSSRIHAAEHGKEYSYWHGEVKELQVIKDSVFSMLQIINSRMADARREYNASQQN